MAKKSKKTVEEMVEEVKDEGIKVEIVAEKPKEKTMAEEKTEKKDDSLGKGEEIIERLGMKFIRNIEEGTMRRI